MIALQRTLSLRKRKKRRMRSKISADEKYFRIDALGRIKNVRTHHPEIGITRNPRV